MASDAASVLLLVVPELITVAVEEEEMVKASTVL